MSRSHRRPRPILRRGWEKFGAIMYGPVVSPSGDGAGVIIGMDPRGTFAVMGLGFPRKTLEGGEPSMQRFFDAHSHAVIGEGIVSLKKAQLMGEAWAQKFRKGLVLEPCACEDMAVATAPAGIPLVLGRPSLAYRMAQTYGMRRTFAGMNTGEPIDCESCAGSGEGPAGRCATCHGKGCVCPVCASTTQSTPHLLPLPSGTRFACGPYVGPTRDTVLADADGNPVASPRTSARRVLRRVKAA